MAYEGETSAAPGAEHSLKPIFENQFSNRQRFKTPEYNLTFVDINPESLSDPVPILLASGWGETPTTHKDTLRTIFNQKRRSITLQYPRIGGTTTDRNNYPQTELRKAEAILGILQSKGIDKIDIIAHSEGAINAIIAASLEPSRIRNIVFVDPAGLTGKDNTTRLAGRFALMIAKDGGRNITGPRRAPNRLRAAGVAIKYFLTNPARGLQEAQAISQADVYEALKSLETAGIGVSIIHGVGDTVFPVERLLESARAKGGISTIGFYSVKGDHRELSVHPEKYTALAVNALEDLAKLPQRRQERLNSQRAIS